MSDRGMKQVIDENPVSGCTKKTLTFIHHCVTLNVLLILVTNDVAEWLGPVSGN